MLPLIEGYRRFREQVYPAQKELYDHLVEGQRPRYLFITCSDSRVDPSEFTQTDPGDLFIDRSLGNLVPAPGKGEHEALAVIEYAVNALGVAHVVICGHSRCGAVKGMLNPDTLDGMPNVTAWLANAEVTQNAVARKHAHLKGDALWDAAVRENVVVQVAHARQLPVIAPRIAAGTLQVHGWVYEIESGRIVVLDEHSGQFVPLEAAYGGAR